MATDALIAGDSGKALTGIDRYNIAGGPCPSTPSPCKFDTFAIITLSSGMKVESITIGNEYWNYNLETGGFIGKGTLSGILRYAEGPCTATALNSGICRFDTRTGYTTTTGIRLESITVGNQFWNFEVDTGNLYTEGLLSAQSRYTTSGLCSTSQPSN